MLNPFPWLVRYNPRHLYQVYINTHPIQDIKPTSAAPTPSMQAAKNAAGKHISASNYPTSSPSGLASFSYKGILPDNRTPLFQLQTSPCTLLTTTSTEQTSAHPPALYGTVNTLLSVRKIARILRKSSRLDNSKYIFVTCHVFYPAPTQHATPCT